MKFSQGIHLLEEKLKHPLPGEAAQYLMAPVERKSSLHYIEQHPEHRLSCVMLLLFPSQNDELKTVLIRRPVNSGVHSSQIAFPGGKSEPEDISPEATALRETFEEVGVPSELITIKSPLTSLFIPVSKFLVQPFIGVAQQPLEFNANQLEVSELIIPGVDELLTMPVTEQEFPTSYGALKAPCFKLYDHIIWGATAMIISEFKVLMQL